MPDVDIAAFRARCERAGLDIVFPFRLSWFNESVDTSLRLPDGGRPGALAILVGNSRHMWPAFARVLQDDSALLDAEHPLDGHVERALSEATARSITDPYVIFWSHRTTPSPIAIQRIAHASGLAHLSPSQLSIHPTYGPWWALRAVIVVDTEGPADEQRRCAPDPCTACSKPCIGAFERALAATDLGRTGDVEREWKSWANVREVCPEGQSFRYEEDQLRYHYAKDRSILHQLVSATRRVGGGA